MSQSPIDLPSSYDSILQSSNAKDLVYSEDINFLASYAAQPSLTVTDLNYTIWYNLTSGYINVWNITNIDESFVSQLTNFHYHVPSEHTIDGEAFDVELQF
jgi:carbonic anhydrase